MGTINRDDMLELTRRMTLKRNCFDRIAGAYLDKDGFVDGTFNKNFRQLSLPDQQKNLDIAKMIPFSETNVALKEYVFDPEEKKQGSVWQLLCALRECELKNDALLDIFYEMFGEKYQASGDYAVYFFHGNYDVPRKAKDKESLWESQELPVNFPPGAYFFLSRFTSDTLCSTSKRRARPGIPYAFREGDTARQIVFEVRLRSATTRFVVIGSRFLSTTSTEA